MGRRKTPNEILRARGSRHARSGPDGLQAPLAIPKKPAFLKGEAAAEWRRVTAELFQQGRICELDRPLLAVWCVTWQHWCQASQIVAEQGELEQKPDGKYRLTATALARDQFAMILAKVSKEFGFTPADRANLPPGQPPPSPNDERLRYFRDTIGGTN